MRRLAATSFAALVAVGLLAGCGSDDMSTTVDKATDGKVKVDKDGKSITVEGDNGSVSLGDATVPDAFPSDEVPLPDDDNLKAVVSGINDKKKKYFSITYSVPNDELDALAKSYKETLKDEGFTIESSSETNLNSSSFAAFTAVGPKWDVIVYSGGTNAAGVNEAALSIQVTPHGTATPKP